MVRNESLPFLFLSFSLLAPRWPPGLPYFREVHTAWQKNLSERKVAKDLKDLSLLGIWRTYHKEAWKMGEIRDHERNVCQVPNPTKIQATASKEGSWVSPLQKQMGSVHINRQRETPSSAHPTVTGPYDQHRPGKNANHYWDRIPSLYPNSQPLQWDQGSDQIKSDFKKRKKCLTPKCWGGIKPAAAVALFNESL